MKLKLPILAALFSIGVSAQITPYPGTPFQNRTSDPTGVACSVNYSPTLQYNGTIYTCQAGVYAASGGGSGTFNALTGDATSTATGGATTVKGANGTLYSSLATGILKNTTGTGVPSIAAAGADYQLPNTGGTCTNQVVTAISTAAVPTCNAVTSSYVDTSIAKTGTDINTSNQVTITHLAAGLPVNQGGTAATTAAAALVNLLPAGTAVGDILYCSAYSASACTAWTLLAGNSSGTRGLVETSSGIPSFTGHSSKVNIGGTGDQLTSAGTFATTDTTSLTAGLAAGTVIHIRAFGVFTTTSTSSPLATLLVKIGSTVMCTSVSNIALNVSVAGGPWFVDCTVSIQTAGGSGSSALWASGFYTITPNVAIKNFGIAGTAAITTVDTTSAQTVSVAQSSTPVSGQTFNLQQLIVEVN
jgi:hypothetical protein